MSRTTLEIATAANTASTDAAVDELAEELRALVVALAATPYRAEPTTDGATNQT